MEEAKLESRGARRYETRDQDILKMLRNEAYEKLGLDTVNMINICITGKSGVGKSTLINGLLGLKPGKAGSAKVDVNECTDSMVAYTHPKGSHIQLSCH